MQGQSSTSEPFCEAFEFEHGSSSSNLGLNQLGFENNGSHNILENQYVSAYTLSSGNSSIPSGSVAALQSAGLISWMSVEPSSSSHMGNQNNHNEIKFQNDWITSVASSSGVRQGQEENQSQATNMLSPENLDIDLNINHVENIQSLSDVSDLNAFTPSVGLVAPSIGVCNQVQGSGLYLQPPLPGLVHPQLVASSSSFSGSHGSSSRTNNFHGNGGGQQGLLLGGRCSLHKRKGVELGAGHASSSGSSSNLNQGLHIPHEDISTRLGISNRVMTSDSHSFCNTAGNQEGFPRNSRMRTSQPLQPDYSLSHNLPRDNIVNHSNNWSVVHQSSAPPVPSNQLLESRLLGDHAYRHIQPNVSSIPSLPSNTHPIVGNRDSTSRIGSRSNPITITSDTNATEEPNFRNFQRNDFIPSVNTSHVEQDPIDGLNNGNTVVPGHALNASRSRSVFAAYQPPGSSGVSLQQRRDNFRRSFYPSSSVPRGQNTNLPSHPGHFSTPPEVGRVPARLHLPSFMTVPPILPDRQNEDAPPIPLPVRHRRNPEMYMADLLRRMDHSFFEDVLLFERSMLIGAAEFHDQHREMRLDVDNMSYEELLALEERIGIVNTGLDEEKIKKCLKQRKYVSITFETSSQVEPCCICQEEYIEGEDLGQLDCGHDFHSACIKQWLVIKNSCPICKNTALNT